MREEVKGKITRVICEIGEQLETVVSRLPRGDSQAAVPRRNAGSKYAVVEKNPFMVVAASRS